jgi:hypothetical protein
MPAKQGGAVMVVSLIMLVMLILIVSSAYIMSSTNLRAVGNMQSRDEAIAAANRAIEQVIGSAFTDSPAAESIDVDIDNDGTNDYAVAIAEPTCIRVTQASADSGPSSGSLGSIMAGSAATWHTEWDIDATATNLASGAAARVHAGVRVLLSDSQKNAVCP